ncbi:GNAT family N-acetyltransferase [Mariniflexile sp.]|uniref:GNAT family N-acetyltransferase n=1 Tax=Mariniflexile sp. TaxID=1979402 RepID=UPI003562AFF5
MISKSEAYRVRRYSNEDFDAWNAFVEKSKNGTFLFDRHYMDYHSDRFEDCSLMVFKKDKLLAVFPANKLGEALYSHQGLTYGGLILSDTIKFEAVTAIVISLLQYLMGQQFKTLYIKQIPSIYSKVFTEELNYLFFILKAELVIKDILSVINLKADFIVSKDRLDGYKRALKHHLVVKEVDEMESFWNQILIKNLRNKHKTKPVHSLEEITLLKSRFPKHIRQFNVYDKDKIVAGTTIFETHLVAHSQYISGNQDKNLLGSLDFLHFHLIKNVFQEKTYFDFGCSNENNGLHVNKGLLYWKEGFGAKTVTQEFYKVDVGNWELLKTVFI